MTARLRPLRLISLALLSSRVAASRLPPPVMVQSAVGPRGIPPRRLVDVDLGFGKTVGVVAAWPVWPAAQALARILAHAPSICRGKRVLELGCGLGAVGLAAAGSKAKEVLLTDADSAVLQQVADLVARDRPFDLVLAADVLYAEAAPSLAYSPRGSSRAWARAPRRR